MQWSIIFALNSFESFYRQWLFLSHWEWDQFRGSLCLRYRVRLELEHSVKRWDFNLSNFCFLCCFVFEKQILPVNIKGLAGSIATLANWFFSWLVTMTANLLLAWSSGGFSLSPSPSLSETIELFLDWNFRFFFFFWTGTFTLYALVSAFTVVFVTLWVPETKGKTLEELQALFRWANSK